MSENIIDIRISKLFDRGSFKKFTPERSNGFVTGCGKINGREVMASFIDPVNEPESMFMGISNHLDLLEKALETKTPAILIMDMPAQHKTIDKSPFPKDPIKLLADKRGVGRWYFMQSKLSGKVPQIAVVLNRLGASLTFPVALCDVAVMTANAGMSVGRPDVVEKMTGRKVDYNELGGPDMHYNISGSIDHVAKDEDGAFEWVKNYFDHMPGALKKSAVAPEYGDDKMKGAVHPNPNFAFDTHEVIKGIVDAGSFFELKKGYAGEIITGFGRVEGKPVGIIANNSCARGGLFFPETCRKSARFISICSAYGIPAVFLADAPGFMIGPEVEKNAIIREGALLFSTIANSRMPKISIVLRRDYTAGVYAMAGPGFDPESFIALPGAVISIYGKSVAEKLSAREAAAGEMDAMNEMMSGAEDPKKLLEMGLLDEIVDICSLRPRILRFLEKASGGVSGSGVPVLLV